MAELEGLSGREACPKAIQASPAGNRRRPALCTPHLLGTPKRPPLARGLESRGLCLHILGEPEQNGEPHFSKEQQVVGKLPGAHLTRGPAVGSGNKHGKVPEAPGPGSENRLGACGDLGLLDKQLGWWPRIPAMGEGSASSSICHPRLLAMPRLPLPAQVTGSEARGGWEGRPGGGNRPADSRERPPWALPRGPSQAAGWGQAGTGPSVPRTHTGSRVTPPSPRGQTCR